MMNEFPSAFIQAHHRIAAQGSDPGTVAINGTEYLELLEAAGVGCRDFPPIQAVQQHKLWQQLSGPPSPATTEAAIARLQASDPSFSMAGASWTNNLSWVEGYANVLEPLARLSADFHRLFDEQVAQDPSVTKGRALSAGSAPPAAAGNQLLPLLGPGHLDRLRQRDPPAWGCRHQQRSAERGFQPPFCQNQIKPCVR